MRLRRFGAALPACAFALATAATPAGAQVMPSFAYGDGPVAAARLGFATALAANLIDTPPSLAQPTVQRFLDDLFARLVPFAPTPELRQRARDVRAELAGAGSPSFARATASADVRTFNAALVGALPPDLAHAFVIGGLTNQIAYNARAYHERSLDQGYRGALGTLGDLDAALPGLDAARTALANADGGDWRAIARAVDKVTAVLLGADPILLGYGQPARPNDVWLIFVRFREIAEDGPRKDTGHASIDVVYADGVHKTIGAYPDGKYAFAHDGGTLTCALDLEPDDGDSRVTPVVPPAGTTYDEIAQRFFDACDAFDRRPPVTYEALALTGFNDNSFLAGALKAAGFDPATFGFSVGSAPAAPAASPAASPAPSGT